MGCQQHAWPAHAPEQVEAEVNYIRDNGQRPVAYTYPAPAGTPQRSALLQPTRVAIRNARLLAQPASLEREGFQLVREASAVGDFEDEAQVRERYYPESIALLRRLTGAAEAVIFDHTLRVDQAGREERGLREPVRYVHNDQTLRSAPRRVRDHLPAECAERRLAGRFQIVNLWRPFGHPAQRAPLALLDARSLAFDDLVASDLVYRDKVGETYSVKPNPEHRWYYYPHLLPEGSAAAEDLRFAGGRAGPPRRAHRLRRSLHPGRCAAAAEYRTALPAVLRRMSQAGRRLIQ